MQRMPSLLESRHRLLHLRASLERESVQTRYLPVDIGSSLNPELCHSVRATSWPSFWEEWSTKDHYIAHNLRRRCIKRGFEGIHDRFLWDLHILWISNQHWSNWRSPHPDRRGRAERLHLSNDGRWVLSIRKELISLNKSGKFGPMRNRSDFNFAKSLEKSNSRRFLSGHTSNGIHLLLHPAHLDSSGTIPGGAQDNKQESPQLSSCKEQHDRSGRPVVPFLHTTSDMSTFKIFSVCCSYIVHSWQQSAATDGCVWTPHLTRPFFSAQITRTCVAEGSSRAFVVRASLVMIHPHALMCLFWLSLSLSSLC